MHRLNPIKVDIKFFYNGRIDIRANASRRMQLDANSRISFYLDNDNNLYVKKEKNGLKPASPHGRNTFRFYSADTTRQVLRLPDVPKGIDRVGFRIGEPEAEGLFPIITRMPL